MANTGTMVINPFVYTKNAYVTLRDFTPIARTAQPPLALVVNNDVPVRHVIALHEQRYLYGHLINVLRHQDFALSTLRGLRLGKFSVTTSEELSASDSVWLVTWCSSQ